MEVPFAFSLHQALAGDPFALLLGDPYRDAQTARLIDLAEAVAERQGLSKAVKARLAFVLVEAFQNIIRHRPVRAAAEGGSGFLFRAAHGGQQVITCNPVGDADLPALRRALDGVLGKGPDELKSLFLQGLQANATSAKGGAGLGLIEMARRSGRELGHALGPMGDGLHRFILHVLMGDAEPLPFGRVAELCDLQHAGGVVAAMHGEAAPALMNAMLGLVWETGVGGEALHSCLLAATQFLDDTAAARSGPMLLAVRHSAAGGPGVLVGATWGAQEAQRSAERVDELLNATAFQLQRRYRASLHQPDPIGKGLLELAMRATGGITSGTWPAGEGAVFTWVEART